MITVHLKLGKLRGPLILLRDPLYLRFVMVDSDWKTLDALDQIDDAPKPEETVLVANRIERGTAHIDGVKDGKRFGKWLETATYELITPAIDQNVVRDTAQWQQWCSQQIEAVSHKLTGGLQ